eukprot:737000_1
MKLSLTTILLASGLSGGAAFMPSSLSSRTPTTGLNVASAPGKAASSTSSFPDGSNKEWSPDSWKKAIAKQMPVYESQEELDDAIATLDRVAPLVFAGEVRSLHEKLARVSQGQGFVLMGGDCAESFKEFHVNHIR